MFSLLVLSEDTRYARAHTQLRPNAYRNKGHAFGTSHVMKALLFAVSFMSLVLARHSSAVDFSTVDFVGKPFTVCRVNVRKEHLQVFHRDESGQPFKRF